MGFFYIFNSFPYISEFVFFFFVVLLLVRSYIIKFLCFFYKVLDIKSISFLNKLHKVNYSLLILRLFSCLILILEFIKLKTLFINKDFVYYSSLNSLFIENSLVLIFKLLIWFIFFILVFFSKGIRRYIHILEETAILLLVLFFFLVLIPNTNDFLSLYLLLEGSTITFLALIMSVNRSQKFMEATTKYFFLSTIATMFFLIGLAIVFLSLGDLSFYTLIESMHSIDFENLKENPYPTLPLGGIFLLLSFAYKLTLFPSHLWAPDIYDSLGYSFLLIIGSAVKISVFLVFLKLINMFKFLPYVLITFCVGSMVIGAFGATRQMKMKRLLAFSSTAQLGFLFLGVSTSMLDMDFAVYQYTILGFIIYNLTLIAFILVLLYLRNTHKTNIVYITDLANLYSTNPIAAFILLVLLASMAGLPPFIGFWAKYWILMQTVSSNSYIIFLIAVFLKMVSNIYYLGLIKLMFWEYTALNPLGVIKKNYFTYNVNNYFFFLIISLILLMVFLPWFCFFKVLPFLEDLSLIFINTNPFE